MTLAMLLPRLRPVWRVAFPLALVVAFVIALRPAPDVEPAFSHQDKVMHFIAFAGLTLLGALAWPARLGRIVVLMLAYGLAMELAQATTAHRRGDWADWLADAAGILLAAWLSRRQMQATTRVRPAPERNGPRT